MHIVKAWRYFQTHKPEDTTFYVSDLPDGRTIDATAAMCVAAAHLAENIDTIETEEQLQAATDRFWTIYGPGKAYNAEDVEHATGSVIVYLHHCGLLDDAPHVEVNP
jgi:hypothetical protein